MQRLAQSEMVTQQRHNVSTTLPNFKGTSLIRDPTPGELVDDLLVFSHLIHNLARHIRDDGNQQGLWKVLEARLDQ